LPGVLYLIDGHYQIYRGFFGPGPNLSNSRGMSVKAIYALVDLLLRLRERYEIEHWAIAMDAPGPTFRHERFPEYKATREEMPDPLVAQLPWIDKILAGFRIPILTASGIEADDWIASASRAAERAGYEVRILSRDKDLEQILSERVRFLDEKSGDLYGPAELLAKKGIRPDQVVDYLALVGDTSDNIPGVAGIGPKGAAQLLGAVGEVERVLADPLPAGVPPKTAQKIRDQAESYRLSRELVILRDDLPLPVPIDQLAVRPPDVAALRPIFLDLGLRRFLEWLEESAEDPLFPKAGEPGAGEPAPPAQRPASRTQGELPMSGPGPDPVPGPVPVPVPGSDSGSATAGEYVLIDDLPSLERALAACRGAGRFAFDTETTGLDPIVDRAVGFSLAWRPGEAVYVPLEGPGRGPLPRAEVLARLAPLLEDPAVGKVGHNIKYDAQVMRSDGIRLRGIAFDSMIAAFLIEPSPGGLSLDDLAGERLGHRMIPIGDVIGRGDAEVSMADLPPEAIRDYAAEDADFTLRLAEHLGPEIESRGLGRVLRELELPLVEVLVEMEREGITLDVGRLREQQEELERAAARLEAEIHAAAGAEFNVASPKQLQGILFEKLGLPILQKTKTGPSTSADVLEELALLRPDVPVPALVLEHRKLTKLLSTYITALPEMVKPATGRLHTDFRQTVAATGRLSSMEPNLQNIPVRGEAGRQIRRAFVPNRPGDLFLSADYSQIELRILAHLSRDATLVAALRAGEDIHAAVAARIHDKPIGEVTREERAAAKAVNFGLIYGMGAFGLARGLRIGRQEAQEFIETFFARFPGVKDFIETTKESARESGEVRTLFGRRRPVPEIRSRLPRERAQGERVAVNSVVQGSAADVIKKAMIDVQDSIEARGSRARLILQIHDELLLEVPAAELEAEAGHLRERMEGVIALDVPLVVSVSSGNDWYDAGK